MRISKILFLAIFLTSLCLLYVFQQSEIFRLGYAGQKKAANLQDLLDKNTLLRYNIEKNISLVRLGDTISQAKDYEMPEDYQLVKLPYLFEEAQSGKRPPEKQNIIARFFSVKRTAEAGTLKP